VEHVVEPVSAPTRRVAPGGWRRAAVGVALGVVAGALVSLVVPRDGHEGAGTGTLSGSARTGG
jgi:hypothetical protein